ncbi:MAG: hypothetical protein Pg6C_02970 [Treponemataceae bacterium]|nr:MAG: hypothetical protein Pg6C_02970 [Treponemataceae bacterium]
MFVAGGGSGKIWWTDDLTAWHLSPPLSGFSQDIDSIIYARGKFIAAGNNGKMLYSVDGKTWVTVSNSAFGTSHIIALAYTNGLWVAVSDEKIFWCKLE